MTFRDAIDACPELKGQGRAGTKALGSNAKHVRVTAPTGSLDIDEALRPHLPQDHRYDYGIGLPARGRRKDERVVWVEVHSAYTSEVSRVLKKQDALARWLRTHAPDLNRMTTRYVWVPSGRVRIPKRTPQYRQLAKSRVDLCSSPCSLP